MWLFSVRLGISKSQAAIRHYNEEEYLFCCEGCADMFEQAPEILLEETSGFVVCPTCLAEKQTSQTVEIMCQGEKWYFCKCPHCVTIFLRNPEYYTKRLSGEIQYSGVFSDEQLCCI